MRGDAKLECKNIQSRVETTLERRTWGSKRRPGNGVVLLVESVNDLVSWLGELEMEIMRFECKHWGREWTYNGLRGEDGPTG